MIGIDGVLAITAAVRAAVRDAVAAGERPLVLAAAARSCPARSPGCATRSARGVAYVDGHVDVYDGRTSPTGEAADMPMGVAFGLGPGRGSRRRRRRRPRPATSSCSARATPRRRSDIAALLPGELAALRSSARRAARRGLRGRRASGRRPAGRFWIHLDVDVLDEVAMPATDYLMPGGLEWDELAALMAPLGAAPALVGLSLGCVNPEKDPDGATRAGPPTCWPRRSPPQRGAVPLQEPYRVQSGYAAASTMTLGSPPLYGTVTTLC